MPIATPEIYAQMLDRAKQQGFAYPAINVTSSQTLNAALKGFADAESDGIIQISTGGAEYLSGQSVKDMVTGATALAEFAHVVAGRYPVNVALHTDHCPKDKLDGYMRPLVAISAERVKSGKEPLFQSHMWDGSAVPLAENLEIAKDLLARCAEAKIIMELEIGVVGGEEDGVVGEINEKLYSTTEDALATAEALGLGERGRYILAATFGNVHGVYKPGHVKLRPSVLKEIQDAVGAKYGKEKPFDLVFHGGSGSAESEIREAIGYGVVKMNVDTDTQYAFTRPVAAHMFGNYDGVLKVDGEVGQQEGLRPAHLGQVRRGGHGGPGHPGLPGPALRRHQAFLASIRPNGSVFHRFRPMTLGRGAEGVPSRSRRPGQPLGTLNARRYPSCSSPYTEEPANASVLRTLPCCCRPGRSSSAVLRRSHRMSPAALARAARQRRKPRLGSWDHGTGPWPFQPFLRRASRLRW